MIAGLLALSGLLGCGPKVDCADPASPLAEVDGQVLTCAEGAEIVEWMQILGGRPLPARGDGELAQAAVAMGFVADPAATRGWMGAVRERGAALAVRTGLDAAEARSREVWLADRGEGLVGPDDGWLWNLQQRTLSVWTKDDEEQLALTESDLEGWIRYASLCREAQGGGVVRVSVADRVTVYQMLIDRFDAADRANQVALASLGPVWPQVVDAWAAAPYEQQQAWIAAAPLPPPMTATSLAYVGAVFEGDLVRHARALQEVLGPFSVDPTAHFGSPDPVVPGSQPGWRQPAVPPPEPAVQVEP